MPTFLDPDIAAMTLAEMEKNGPQVFRNYSKAFDAHRAKIFAESAQTDERALPDGAEILRLVASQEPRTLPVIVRAVADDPLKEMFRREIPDGVPGDRGELLSGFGPLSRLSQRVQMAYAFGFWVPALKAKLAPQKVLYGSSPPAMLGRAPAACLEVTRKVIAHEG